MKERQTAEGEPGARWKMEDVAKLAGVSVATVSRALAGSPLVTRATRERIEAAVARTGYVVNHVASGLRRQTSRQLLVLLPTIANSFFAEIVLGVEEAAQARQYGVLIGNTEKSAAREAALARQLMTGAVDGLILLTGRRPLIAIDGGDVDRRCVAISERIADAAIPTLSIDHTAAARDAVDHLLALGHRRIAHLAGPKDNVLTAARLAGHRAARPVPAALLRFGDFTFDSGARAMRALLPARPTAVFCANDEMAIGAIQAAKAAGLRVPADLSVVGFDDIAFAAVYDPPLTTVRQPRRELGRRAVEMLLAQLSGEPLPTPEHVPHELIIRASTAAPSP